MRPSVFTLSFNSLLKPLLLWGIGLAAFLFLITGLYPVIAAFPDLAAWVQTMFQAAQGFFGNTGPVNSPDGFIFTLGFSLAIPLACSLFAILSASQLVATQDERGMMDLLLSRPIPRWRVVLEKYAALGLDILLICASLWALLAWQSEARALGFHAGNLAQLLVSLALLSLCWGGIALAIGILTRSRERTIQFGLGLLAVSLVLYLAPGISGQLMWARSLSLLAYYLNGNLIAMGLNWAHAAVLVGLSTVFVVTGLVIFQNRDL